MQISNDLRLVVYNACWDADGSGTSRDVVQHDGICAYLGVISNRDTTYDFCSRTNIDMTSDTWDAARTQPYSDLLEYQAIWSDHRIPVYHDSIGMRQQQAASNLRAKANICSSYNAPKAMSKYGKHAHRPSYGISLLSPSFVAS
jgi:hypothetical protein